MDLQPLRYFLAVARAGSFVRAAEALGISQPSLSQQIQKLERELGVHLFDRLGRTVRLTAYGEALREPAQRVLREVEDTRRRLEAMRTEDGGELKVGVIPTVLPYSMVEPLAAFRQRYPRMELTLVEGMTEVLIEGLRQGELDLALLALPIKHNEIVCSELFREPLLAAIPKGHTLACEERVMLNRLGSEKMLLLREGHCLRGDVLTACTKARAQFDQVFESDHLESILRLVAAGYGVSLVPEKASLGRTDCQFIPVEPRSYRRIGYAFAKGHESLPIRKHLQRFLKDWKWS